MKAQDQITQKVWKKKAVERNRRIHRLDQEVKRQKLRAGKWKKAYKTLKASIRPKKVKHHNYPLELMWMAVCMHILFNVSLRGVSQSLCLLGQLYGLSIDYISPSTIRNWCLKLGFHCLKQALPENDYVVILDESIEIGKERLLVLLGVPIGKHSPIKALSLQDVEVLDIGIQTSWSSAEIQKRILPFQQQANTSLVYGISDGGSNLRNALKMCDLVGISDCTHKIANSTKAIFKDDEMLTNFVKKINGLRAKWVLSKYNFYLPPSMRSKARFHQIFKIHNWANFILDNWAAIPQEAKEELDFIKQNPDFIKLMGDFQYLIDCFCKLFKNRGIQANTQSQWAKIEQQYRQQRKQNIPNQVNKFIADMNQYLKKQLALLPNQNQILCCSDIIESTFGKYKNKGGVKMITEDALMIAAYTKKHTLNDVKIAMEQTKIEQIKEWKKQNTIVSKLARIKRMKMAKTAA